MFANTVLLLFISKALLSFGEAGISKLYDPSVSVIFAVVLLPLNLTVRLSGSLLHKNEMISSPFSRLGIKYPSSLGLAEKLKVSRSALLNIKLCLKL